MSTLLREMNDESCAICLDSIEVQETALVKGCDHAYCVKCILQWATYRGLPKCPQCKHPFESLIVHRALDGSLHEKDMFEESVRSLLRATWFIPLVVETYYDYKEDDDDVDIYPYSSPSGPHRRPTLQYYGSRYSSRQPKHKEINEREVGKDVMGRRAKRAVKREAMNEPVMSQHEQNLVRVARLRESRQAKT